MADSQPEELQKAMTSKKKTTMSTAMKRTSEWIFSQEIPSDVAVYIGEISFALHKFPLVSKSGYIRNLVSESPEADVYEIRIPNVPGGAEAFEFAAKFCYGINFEISTENIATLRCLSEFLEMTEEFCVGNLVMRTEAYLNEVALKSLAGAITILHSSQALLPMAEKVKLVGRCIDAIAFEACKESQLSSVGRFNGEEGHLPRQIVDWWAEDLSILRIDLFQRVIVAMLARGFKHDALGPALMLYVKKSLRGLEPLGKGKSTMEARQEHEKRVILETIVSLLPRGRNVLSVSFLSMLLRSAIYLETTVACRLDLEKRMALQLGQAVLDDLLIPLYSFSGETLFDVDTIQRVLANYLEFKAEGYQEDNDYHPTRVDNLERVGNLLENYLAEIASDRNLPVSKLVSIAELIPEQSRVTEDGMYRAIDIFLKAHPALSELERKKVCSLMDCQKLSREACAHAAQNDRLPVQTVVQVLFHEQQRLRDAMIGRSFGGGEPGVVSNLSPFEAAMHQVPDELSRLRSENDILKLEMSKMKMMIKEMKKMTIGETLESPAVHLPSSGRPPSGARRSFINTMGKKLWGLYPFARNESSNSKTKANAPKIRRHSMS